MRTLLVTTTSITLLLAATAADAQVNLKGNRYVCYPVEGIRGEERTPGPVKLKDQFGSGSARLQKVRFVCNPVSINGKPVADPKTHLVCYDAIQTTIKPKVVSVEDEFGKTTNIVP